jgi:tRNA modification GTPase
MTDTRVAVLTPPGSGAIAVLAIRGRRAWPVIRDLFRSAVGRRLPEAAPESGVWFGRFGETSADEAILSTCGSDTFEIHCHGGRQIVAWLLGVLRSHEIEEDAWAAGPVFADPAAVALLPFARTVRTATILLDQAHGAYVRSVRQVEVGGPEAESVAATLRRNARVGRHLVEPWRVAIAGLPNAGKSSLLNALAGFDRSVVSSIPGTTRDAVSISLAFDGWPVDLFDTAGLRVAADAVEREGVDRAKATAAESDLVLWVVDVTGPRADTPIAVAEALGIPTAKLAVVFNKTDMADVPRTELPEAIRVSALTGAGVAELAGRIAKALAPDAPHPGDPVPYTSELCDRWS